jgi:hypothetical protein
VVSAEPTGPREFRIRYAWDVNSAPPASWRVFVHFLDSSGEIAFQNDHEPSPRTTQWTSGRVELGPFVVRVPEKAAGKFDVAMGLFDPTSGRRPRLRADASSDRRLIVGTLTVVGDGIAFIRDRSIATEDRDQAVFQRGDGGWTEGLHPFDRFVKNTHEILSPLHELTARLPMTQHEFLDSERRVQRSVFGSGARAYEVVVNAGETTIRRRSPVGGEVDLSPGGFLVEGPEFIAFLARQWAGQTYEAPVLFTLRSVDGGPLSSARRIQVYHGFGDSRLQVWQRQFQVPRGSLLTQ